MALTFDNITAITKKYWLKKFPQLVYDQSILLKKLAAKGTKPESGASIMQSVMYAGMNGGSFSPFDTFDISGKEVITAANFNWKYYQVSIVLSRDELLKNAGAEGVFKVMDNKMKLARLTMADNLSADLFALANADASDSGQDLHSLDNMLEDASNTLSANQTTYGGIDKASYSWWVGQIQSGGGTGNGPVFLYLNQLYAKCVDGSVRPNLLVGHNNSLASYIASQQSNQRYMKQDNLDAGFMTAEFNGIPFIADLHVTDTGTTTEDSNRVYMLNTDFIDLVVHRDENFRLEPFAKPVDQAVIVGHVMWAGELTSSDPSRSGTLYNFDSLAKAE
jgi:hypothetical protein